MTPTLFQLEEGSHCVKMTILPFFVALVSLTTTCFAIPQYGGVSGGPSVPVSERQCNHPSYDCVPYFQCIEGKINTGGVGLIDVRIQPVASCIDPNYPDIPGLCCLIPGAPSTPPPVDVCPNNKECVDYKICGADGKVITDGEGIIDIRTGIHTSCWLSHGIGGVCCTPPTQYVDCPAGSVCTLGRDCLGQALDASSNFIDYISSGSWSFCNYGADDGVCCIPPPPKYVDCPAASTCTLGRDCLGQAFDASSNFVDYISSGSWSFCNYGGQDGVCCIPPPPKYVDCPAASFCTLGRDCLGQALDSGSNFIDYISSGSWSFCNYKGQDGVCCIPPPPPRVVCPGDSLCVNANKCKGRALNEYNSFLDYHSTGVWAQCSYGAEVGVCCEQEVTISTVCPGNSVCLNPADCFGTALDVANNFVDYISTGTWSHCSQYPKGVCCVNPPQCGIRNYKLDQRITNINHNADKEAGFGEFPWQAIVFYANYTYICGASLISDRHVITAAHCVDDNLHPGDIRLRFGEWAVNTYDEPYEYQDKNVKSIYLHPKFNKRNNHFDISVLELAEPFTSFSFHINSICLPGPGVNFGSNYRCIATGWGKDTFDGDYQVILKKVDLPYVPHTLCQDKLRRTRLGKWYALDQSFVCAGGELGKDACTGDGGGPLVCQDKNTLQYVLVGITSFGIGCGELDVPGVYANVEYLLPWVETVVLGNNGQQVAPPGYGK